MTTSIIITLCSLLLLAYVFEISSKLTKIPSVILLLILGLGLKEGANFLEIAIPDISPLLKFFGTIGLILIVLEGSLELQLNKSKLKVISQSTIIALIPMLLLAFLLGFAFHYFEGVSLKIALLNAVPFCVISSAIAIPSVRNLINSQKEFVIYESSLSDIFGVLLFNFLAQNDTINSSSFWNFGGQITVIIVISFFAVLGLSYLLSRIKHHITFTPIILLVILIYALAKIYHLPGLLFVLVLGLFLGNLDELKRFSWIEKFRPVKLDKEVKKFKEITIEATFLIRSLFFLLFGFLMEPGEILNTSTLPWAVGIVLAFLGIRWLTLLLLKAPVFPLLFIAPRGLITILLFIAIVPENSMLLVNKSLIIQTIILTVLIMMFGLMGNKPKAEIQVKN